LYVVPPFIVVLAESMPPVVGSSPPLEAVAISTPPFILRKSLGYTYALAEYPAFVVVDSYVSCRLFL